MVSESEVTAPLSYNFEAGTKRTAGFFSAPAPAPLLTEGLFGVSTGVNAVQTEHALRVESHTAHPLVFNNIMHYLRVYGYDVCIIVSVFIYTGCPVGNMPDFGRMFLTLKYTDLTQNTYIRS